MQEQLNKMANEQNWTPLKKARAQIATYSVQKAIVRVTK